MKYKNWLITGGCGFIGTSLIKDLMGVECNRVCVLDNLSVGTLDDLSKVTSYRQLDGRYASSVFEGDNGLHRCTFVEGDILDEALAINLGQKADVIVHLAANTGVGPSVDNPRDDCNNNINGTLNFLEAARQREGCRFIFASSGAPLGEVETLPIHEKLPSNPVSPYGASKLAGEGYCSAYFHSYGVETVVLRFGNVYGPGSSHKESVVAKYIKLALNGAELEVYGDGTQTRDFIYVTDLIEAISAAATKDSVGGEKFQIATNRESTVAELAEMLLDVLEKHGIEGVRLVYGDARVGDVMRNYSDISKAKKFLNWEPRHDLRKGLEQTVDYFIKLQG